MDKMGAWPQRKIIRWVNIIFMIIITFILLSCSSKTTNARRKADKQLERELKSSERAYKKDIKRHNQYKSIYTSYKKLYQSYNKAITNIKHNKQSYKTQYESYTKAITQSYISITNCIKSHKNL